MSIRFDILTIFPHIFDSYLNESMIKRARAKKLVDIRVHDLRKFTKDKHKKVDDRPYGGGPGMVLKIEPIVRAIDSILRNMKPEARNKILFIIFSAGSKQFTSKMSADLVKKYERVIMICGHYEGIDERIKSVLHVSGFKFQEIMIGPYVLTGGELPAMVVVDAVSRHIKGFLGKEASLEEKRFGVGMPAYSRPEIFAYRKKKYKVPPVLLSGNHARIDEWRSAERLASRKKHIK